MHTKYIDATEAEREAYLEGIHMGKETRHFPHIGVNVPKFINQGTEPAFWAGYEEGRYGS